MERAVPSKRTAARLAAATFGTALVLGAGATVASASIQPSARDAYQGFTVKFIATDEQSATAEGASFGGSGVVTDAVGRPIGTVDDTCDDAADSPEFGPTAFCHTLVKFNDGSMLAADVQFPVANPTAAFTGLITGASGTYSGARGTINIQTVTPGIYIVSFPSA